MVMSAPTDVLRPVPPNPLSWQRQVKEIRSCHSGFEVLRDAGGTDRTRIHEEMLHLLGLNLFDLEDEPWSPRRRSIHALQAVLTLGTVIRRCEMHSCSAEFPLRSPFTTVADGPINVRVTIRCPG